MAVGRNDPCPCGSGKKYKKCCLLDGGPGLQASRSDRETALAALAQFVRGPGWRERYEAAFSEFWDDLDPAMTAIAEEPVCAAMSGQVFEWWFFFDYELDEVERGVADAFLEANPRLSPGVRGFLECARETMLRVYEVTEVRPGLGMTLRDVVSKVETRVSERSGSRQVQRWDVIATRVMRVPGLPEPILDGGVLPIGPQRARDLVARLREVVESEEGESDKVIFGQIVPDVHRAWIEPMQTPSLVNYDGDPLLFTVVHFDVTDEQALTTAFEGAKQLERDGEKWAWTGKGKSRREPVIFGWFSLIGAKLTLQTNSAERAERGRRLVSRLAGDAVTYRLTSTEDPEQAMAAMRRDGVEEAPPLAAELREPAHAAVEQLLVEHYERWLDEPVPRLADMTPREAARSRDARAEVVSMLKELEGMYERALSEGQAAFDPSWLWEELGLGSDRDAPGSRQQAPVLGHESLATHFPHLLTVGGDAARRVRSETSPAQMARVLLPEDLERDLAFQRLARECSSPELALPAALLVANFELFLRKVFWVGESLSWMLGATKLDVTGEAVRLPFRSVALVFTDRYALGLAERMRSRLPDGMRSGRMLQVLTVYATEHPGDVRRESNEDEDGVLDLTFVGDVLDGTPPWVVPCRLELGAKRRLDESLSQLTPGDVQTDDSEGVLPLYESVPLRELVSLVANAVLYATSADAEQREIAPSSGSPRTWRGQNVPVFTSETVFYLPGTIDIKTVELVKRARRGGRGHELSRRCMVRGHWRRAPERWEDQRPRWIQPHWRGPSAAAIVERQYRLVE